MTAYIIGQMHIHERDWMEDYFSKIPSVVEAHRGRFIVRGGDPEKLEGDADLPDAAFILEFPDRMHATNFLELASVPESRETAANRIDT